MPSTSVASLSPRLDPGPGEDRLKFRAAPRVLAFIRQTTHSRDTTAAVRKLLLWGAEGRALPASPSYSRPLFLPAARIPGNETVLSSGSEAPRVTAENWRDDPIVTERAAAVTSEEEAGQWYASPDVSESVSIKNSGPVSAAGIFLDTLLVMSFTALIFGAAYYVLRWLGNELTSAGKVLTGMTKAAPQMAEWAPQAAGSLGALFL